MEKYLLVICLFSLGLQSVQGQDLQKLFSNCHKGSKKFDSCIKHSFNKLTPFFKYGLPEYNVASFDPHTAKFVEQRRGDPNFLGGYRLLLTDVSEYGWTNSLVTEYKTDFENNRIVYSQSFPEKSLDGKYDFRGKVLGLPMHTNGIWNMTLYRYSQTTSITRIGGPGGLLKVRVEIDDLGDLKLHITDLFNGKKHLEFIADTLINNVWQPGFPFLKPIINDLVSTAFTDIFNESFRYFPLNEILPE